MKASPENFGGEKGEFIMKGKVTPKGFWVEGSGRPVVTFILCFGVK